jgi:osmotically-inducible protein OsmY
MEKPSLALIPSGYREDLLYSILPNNGDGDFTFSRAGVSGVPNATRVNKEGLIEDVNADVPRLDYSDGGCPSLLLEPQRTNNILNSESLSNASWLQFNSGTATTPIITDNYAISPSGEMNASRLQMDLNGGTTTSDRTFIRQSLTSQTDYYFSVYLKSTNGSEQKLNWHYGSDDFLITVTDEWQRFELSRSGAATSWAGIGLRGNLVGAIGIDDSVDILVYGFQVEQGSNATTYIPTNGSIATRNIEECEDSGNADLFNDDEGVLYAQIGVKVDNGFIALNDGSTSNRVSMFFNETNKTIRAIVSSGGGSQMDGTYTSPTSISDNVKVALKYKENDFALWVNGVEVLTDSSGIVAIGLSRCDFSINGILPFYGKCKDLRYYDTVLTDAELTELTTL